MTDKSQIGLFDLDGSLANYDEGLRYWLSLMRSPNEEKIGDNLWEIEKHYYIKMRMLIIKSMPGFWLNLKKIDDGFKVFDLSKKIGFDNHILTKGPKKHPTAWQEKVQWCQKYLGEEVDIHITSDKGMVYGKFLYDDYPDYMLKWLKNRPRGLGIMPVNNSNKDFSHPRVIKYDGNNLDEVEKALVVVYNRDSSRQYNCVKTKPGADWYYFIKEEDDEDDEQSPLICIVHKRFWHAHHHIDDRHIGHLLKELPSSFYECMESCFDFTIGIKKAEEELKELGYTLLDPNNENISAKNLPDYPVDYSC